MRLSITHSAPLQRAFPSFCVVLLGLFMACSRPDAADKTNVQTVAKPSAPPTVATNVPAGKPQAKLATIKLWVGKEELITEVAKTQSEIQAGMMFRTSMAENEGMIFVFGRPHRAAFWMKNTLLPLSCAYIDSEGTILEIRDMKPLDETTLTANSDLVQYVLEVNQGYFKRHGIEPGMVIKSSTGTLRETFFGAR